MIETGSDPVPDYAVIKVRPPARDALRRITLLAQAERGQRMTMSEVLVELAAYAERHVTEVFGQPIQKGTDSE